MPARVARRGSHRAASCYAARSGAGAPPNRHHHKPGGRRRLGPAGLARRATGPPGSPAWASVPPSPTPAPRGHGGPCGDRYPVAAPTPSAAPAARRVTPRPGGMRAALCVSDCQLPQ
jgi:hypothetical protein